jgi:hypothetical protein
MTKDTHTAHRTDDLKTQISQQGIQIAPIVIPVGQFEGQYTLSLVLEANGLTPETVKGKDLQRIAENLREFAPLGKKVTWNKDYLDNVMHARRGFDSPAPLIHAMHAYLKAHQGTPAIWAKAVEVTVKIAPGVVVTEGALVTRSSRVCAYEGCQRPYVPNSWNQKCCHPVCTAAHNKMKKAARRAQ